MERLKLQNRAKRKVNERVNTTKRDYSMTQKRAKTKKYYEHVSVVSV